MNILNVWQRDFLLSIVRLVAGAYPVWHQAPPSPT
ncbi:1-acyl-sn-glycerol-3-phosphate acyltransferase, partial [Burkholderia sp. Ac-20365]|nr:1-acyl-sn-glycerol-3-phosphate acyltransferase [Burkholderia sp. Ac-20365]